MVGSVLEPFSINCETAAPCPDCQYCVRIKDERQRCSSDHNLQNIYLPVGNRINDYNLVITVTAKVHCFEVKTTITPQVTASSLCVQKLKETVEHLDELWHQGVLPDDTAARLLLIAANMLNDKMDAENKPDREELREQILHFIADIIAKTPSWTPEEVTAIAEALNPVVQRADELSTEAQEDAALALKTLSLFLLQTTGNKDEEFKSQMQIAAGTLVEVASNMTEFPPSKHVTETLFEALNNTQNALLGLNELDGWPLVIKKGHICMLVNRVKAGELEKLSADLLDDSCTRFSLPDLHNIAPDGEAVNIKVLSFSKNVFSWNKRGNISGVIGSLTMTTKNGTVLPLRDLKEDIEIRLPRLLGEPANVTVLDLRNFSTTIIDIPLKDSSLVIKIVPSEDPLPLKLYLGYSTYPTEQKHLAVTLMPHQGRTIEEKYSWLLQPKDLKGKAGTYYLLVRPVVGPGIKYITGNLSISTFGASCKFWNESLLDWDDYGCRVGQETSHEVVQCFCNHLTFFGSSFFVTPNLVDPSRTAELFGTFGENPVVVCFVGALFLAYLLLLAWARWKDVRDKAKVKVTVLDDNNPMDEYRYLLCVSTGLRRGASTSSLVTVCLLGSEGSSEPHHLANTKLRLFGRGMVDMFLLSTPFSLGDLQAIRLWHNNSGKHPAWYVCQVVVQDLQTWQKWNFLCNSWLAIDMDDCCLDKVFPVSTDADLKKFSNLFYMKTTKDFCDGHLWYSVINGPPSSSFTCVQRVSCCFSLLLCTMLTNIMFYGIPTDPAEQTLDLGAFEFTWQQFMIGVQSSLIMFPVNILIVSVFRYTRPRKTPCCRRKRKQKDKVELDNISGPCSVSFESIAQDIIRLSQSLSDSQKSNAEFSDGKQVDFITALSEVENFIKQNNKSSELCQPRAENLMDPPHLLQESRTSIHSVSKLDGNEMKSNKNHYLYRQLCQIERRLSLLGPSGFPSAQSFAQTQGKVQRMKGLLEDELHTSSNGLPQKREDGDGALKKSSCCHSGLPWWFVFVGWFLVISTSVVAGYFTMLYGLKFGKDRSVSWLTSMLISFFQSILVIQPLKVLCLAVFFALVIKKIDDDQMDELAFVRPSAEAVKREAQLYAPPLPVDIEVMKRNKVKELKAYALMTEILIYLFFMWMLLLVAHGQRDQNAFFLHRHVQQSFSRGISNSMSVQDVFTWANTSLLRNLFGVHPGFITDGNSKLVGNARLRQVRVKTRSCETAEWMSDSVPSCHAPYSWETEDTGGYGPNWDPIGQDQITQNTSDPWKYQTESELRSHSVRGKILLYRGGGFVAELGPDFHRATRTLTDLFRNKWLDSYTRAIFIEFTVYNANVNLFCIITLLLETAAVGAFEFQSELQTIRLYNSTDGFYIFIMATEITYMLFILYFMFQQGKLMKQQGREYFRSKWNLLELSIILLSWCAVAAFIVRTVLGDQDLMYYQKNKKQFASFYNTAVADYTLQYLMAFIVLLASVKLWHLLRLNPKMNMLTATLQRAWPDLCGFALVIFIMIIAYSTTSNLIYGWEISSYKTFITALMTIIKMQIGVFDYDEVLEHNPVLGALLFGSCIVFMTFVVLNLLISVILVAFNMEQLYHQPSEEEEIVDLMLKKICSLFGIKYNASQPALPPEGHSGGHVVLHDEATILRQS
ncbi:polycystin-1-like protein 2 [Synchiropus picturatus]